MYIGIDFGTSFSQAATVILDQPMVLQSPGEYGIPSAFFYSSSEDEIQIGQDALDYAVGSDAEKLIVEVKMKLEQSFTVDGRVFTSKEIVKAIVKNVVRKAVEIAKKKNINSDIEGIVLTVPAKFDLQKRNLIISAVKTCLDNITLPVIAVIKEPVAAALAYFKSDLENDKCILIYDLGGGTCDIALVRSNNALEEKYEVIDSDMLWVGGRHWDQVVQEYLLTDLKNHRINLDAQEGYEEHIRQQAIKAKQALSEKEKYDARITICGRVVKVSLIQDTFEEITSDLLNQTLDCLKNVYDRNASRYTIDEIVLVGGSSRMKQVETGIHKMFPFCHTNIFEPEHAVVKGAAVFAEMLRKTGQAEQLVDRSNFSYGIGAIGQNSETVLQNLIKVGDKIPAKGTKLFAPERDGQRIANFEIYESDERTDECLIDYNMHRLIGCLRLQLPDNITKSDNLTCTLKLNDISLLDVYAVAPDRRQVKADIKLEEI